MSRFTGLFCLMYCLFAVIAFASGQFSKPMPMPMPIAGGHEIKILVVPYQVSLQLNEHFCGGSIISPTWIISAAHCTYGLDGVYGNITIRVGSSNHASGGEVVKVKRMIAHEQYNPVNYDYDVVLLELEEPLKFDVTKQPIALPDDSESIADGTVCKVTGWGDTLSFVESFFNLRVVLLKIVNQQECSKSFGNLITHNMICAADFTARKDACQRDSGGPMVCRNKLIGIISWGYGCAEPNYPGVYCRVQAVRSWIREISGI